MNAPQSVAEEAPSRSCPFVCSWTIFLAVVAATTRLI